MSPSRHAHTIAAGSFSTMLFLAAWELLGRWFHVKPVILPLPTQIFAEIGTAFGWYMGHTVFTLMTTLAGFALSVVIGVLIAAILVSSRLFERYLYPLIVAVNNVPKVAIAPLLVIWMGTGTEPKVAIAFLIAVFAIIVDTVHGLRSVPADVADLAHVLRGSWWHVFIKVKLPCALPSILSGMKIAISLALVGAIVGEFVSSQRGLGFVIMSAQGMFDTVRVFAAIFILSALGLLLYGLVVWLEARLTHWRPIRED